MLKPAEAPLEASCRQLMSGAGQQRWTGLRRNQLINPAASGSCRFQQRRVLHRWPRLIGPAAANGMRPRVTFRKRSGCIGRRSERGGRGRQTAVQPVQDTCAFVVRMESHSGQLRRLYRCCLIMINRATLRFHMRTRATHVHKDTHTEWYCL